MDEGGGGEIDEGNSQLQKFASITDLKDKTNKNLTNTEAKLPSYKKVNPRNNQENVLSTMRSFYNSQSGARNKSLAKSENADSMA